MTVLPPFLVGMVVAVGMETSGALLLYVGAGLLSALSVVVAVDVASLGAGLGVGWGAASAGLGMLRRRWLAALLAYAMAAILSAGWLVSREFGTTAFGRALGLGLLAAWPLYATGTLLAGLALQRFPNPHAGNEGRAVAVSACAGATLGFLLAGLVLIPQVAPPSIFLGCVVALSGGALLFGSARQTAAAEAGGSTGRSRRATGKQEVWDMRDQVVLITGVGGRGQVGFAVAEALLKAGAKVVITARDPARVQRHVAALAPAGAVTGTGADLTKPEDASAVVATAVKTFGRLNGVVNAVGGLHHIAPLADTDDAAWDREVYSNLWTVYHVCRAAIGPLRETRGAIVNFASRTALQPVKNLGAYTVGKAGVVALTRTLALEELEHGVRVNALAPGMMDTEQNRNDTNDPAAVAWVGLDEVAATVMFLLSGAASTVTGQVVELVGRKR